LFFRLKLARLLPKLDILPINKQVKSKKPTVGFLNPPYKADKKTDTDELEFILNNLDCLVDGGTCVAIVPMQSALAQTGKVFDNSTFRIQHS